MKEYCPTVSVLLCVYNGGVELSNAIESILNQSYKDFEFVIVNDGSTDNSWETINRYAATDRRIVAISHANMGLTKSLNRGLDFCRGKFIARQDADDVSDVKRLEKQVSMAKFHNLIFSRAYKNGRIVPAEFLLKFPIGLLFETGNVLVHGTLFAEAGLIKSYRYDESYKYAQDFDLYIRMLKDGHVPFVISEPLYTLGVSENQISSKKSNEQSQCVLDSMQHNSINVRYFRYLMKMEPGFSRNVVRTFFLMYLLATSFAR